METPEDIRDEIRNDPANMQYTRQNIAPLYQTCSRARILIVGQAPGQRTQEAGIVWKDRSGDRLRDWLGVSEDTFYNSGLISVLPMDFYFPGSGKSGDLPPRKGFADKWHPRLLAAMPDIELTVLVGNYAVRHYLHLKPRARLTDVVKDYRKYLPEYFPLIHPSPRNQLWMSRNPWFADQVLPDLRKRVREILK